MTVSIGHPNLVRCRYRQLLSDFPLLFWLGLFDN